MKMLTSTTAILMFCSSMAFAFSTDAVIADFQAQGFTRVEVKNGLTQTKVEAIRGTEKVEVIYDSVSGAVLKREVDSVDAGDNTAPGVSVRDINRDFLDTGEGDDGSDDEGDDNDSGGDENDSDDDSDDDNGGDENDGDENDSDDDNGGDENDGDENDSDDDNGGDDNGGDENDGDDDHGSNDD